MSMACVISRTSQGRGLRSFASPSLSMSTSEKPRGRNLARTALRAAGYRVEFLPDADEAQANRGLNFVCLGPRRILMVGHAPRTRGFYESLGIGCTEVDCSELSKAAGAIGCLTGVLERERIAG